MQPVGSWGVICHVDMCNESAEAVSLTNSEETISNLLLTREHCVEWAQQFSQDHCDDIKTYVVFIRFTPLPGA